VILSVFALKRNSLGSGLPCDQTKVVGYPAPACESDRPSRSPRRPDRPTRRTPYEPQSSAKRGVAARFPRSSGLPRVGAGCPNGATSRVGRCRVPRRHSSRHFSVVHRPLGSVGERRWCSAAMTRWRSIGTPMCGGEDCWVDQIQPISVACRTACARSATFIFV
jgi:hypothetical protein